MSQQPPPPPEQGPQNGGRSSADSSQQQGPQDQQNGARHGHGSPHGAEAAGQEKSSRPARTIADITRLFMTGAKNVPAQPAPPLSGLSQNGSGARRTDQGGPENSAGAQNVAGSEPQAATQSNGAAGFPGMPPPPSGTAANSVPPPAPHSAAQPFPGVFAAGAPLPPPAADLTHDNSAAANPHSAFTAISPEALEGVTLALLPQGAAGTDMLDLAKSWCLAARQSVGVLICDAGGLRVMFVAPTQLAGPVDLGKVKLSRAPDMQVARVLFSMQRHVRNWLIAAAPAAPGFADVLPLAAQWIVPCNATNASVVTAYRMVKALGAAGLTATETEILLWVRPADAALAALTCQRFRRVAAEFLNCQVRQLDAPAAAGKPAVRTIAEFPPEILPRQGEVWAAVADFIRDLSGAAEEPVRIVTNRPRREPSPGAAAGGPEFSHKKPLLDPRSLAAQYRRHSDAANGHAMAGPVAGASAGDISKSLPEKPEHSAYPPHLAPGAPAQSAHGATGGAHHTPPEPPCSANANSKGPFGSLTWEDMQQVLEPAEKHALAALEHFQQQTRELMEDIAAAVPLDAVDAPAKNPAEPPGFSPDLPLDTSDFSAEFSDDSDQAVRALLEETHMLAEEAPAVPAPTPQRIAPPATAAANVAAAPQHPPPPVAAAEPCVPTSAASNVESAPPPVVVAAAGAAPVVPAPLLPNVAVPSVPADCLLLVPGAFTAEDTDAQWKVLSQSIAYMLPGAVLLEARPPEYRYACLAADRVGQLHVFLLACAADPAHWGNLWQWTTEHRQLIALTCREMKLAPERPVHMHVVFPLHATLPPTSLQRPALSGLSWYRIRQVFCQGQYAVLVAPVG